MNLDLSCHPHRRYNILTNEWILVSPHRTKRPWQGKEEHIPITNRPSFDPKCYLCPGNIRAGGEVTPVYNFTYSFVNDFGSLLPGTSKDSFENGILKAKGEIGICKVLCFSPDHSLTLPQMPVSEIIKVISLWQKEYQELGHHPDINHVQIFENKGEIMGCSNPHPHGQIWAQNSVPQVVMLKSKQQKKYWTQNGKSLLKDYTEQELKLNERIISTNEFFVTLVPFWATWPYEALIIPRRHVQDICQISEDEKVCFAQSIKELTQRYDRLFNISFPYSSGIHQRPTNGMTYPEWHFHMSFYPPLLRSATVKKFMVGYEMFGNPQRDITAEMAADKLKNLG